MPVLGEHHGLAPPALDVVTELPLRLVDGCDLYEPRATPITYGPRSGHGQGRRRAARDVKRRFGVGRRTMAARGRDRRPRRARSQRAPFALAERPVDRLELVVLVLAHRAGLTVR